MVLKELGRGEGRWKGLETGLESCKRIGNGCKEGMETWMEDKRVAKKTRRLEEDWKWLERGKGALQ